MGWRTNRYGPRSTSSCPSFNVTTPLQLRPRVTLAQSANARPAAHKNAAAHAIGIAWGIIRRFSGYSSHEPDRDEYDPTSTDDISCRRIRLHPSNNSPQNLRVHCRGFVVTF